ncbi:hypothetical protein [Candidatus Erwinia haradaeae]|uniref:hypothetical protein n=1 Tax=Candidatus Erwinia haradaeae TaxID=1922217 RepID=UPI00130062ED|nr:hypothetical protein [Candidatus Erwinia haradaeae]
MCLSKKDYTVIYEKFFVFFLSVCGLAKAGFNLHDIFVHAFPVIQALDANNLS